MRLNIQSANVCDSTKRPVMDPLVSFRESVPLVIAEK
jgi:hypothetical protein